MKTVQGMLGPGLALAGLLVAGGLSAQQPGQGMGAGQMGGMHMGGMMMGMEHMEAMAGIHAYDPATLLSKASDLSLTKDQVSKLETLAADTKVGWEKAQAEHNAHHAQLAALFTQASPDPAKVSEHARAAMEAMAGVHSAQLAAFAKAKGVLTDVQRAKVEAQVTEHPMPQGAGGMHHRP